MTDDPRGPLGAVPDADSVNRGEINSDLTLTVPSAGGVLRLLARSLTLRCPHCGGRPILVHWFRLRQRCGACHELLERGEHDYFLGAMLFNLLLGEFIFTAVFVTILLSRWPAVPWDAIQVLAPLGMIVAPLLTYPFSKVLWLSFDLALRPGPGSR